MWGQSQTLARLAAPLAGYQLIGSPASSASAGLLAVANAIYRMSLELNSVDKTNRNRGIEKLIWD